MPIVSTGDNQGKIVDSKGNAMSASSANKTLFVPKFFHKSVLTGKGGQTRGLLNENRDPKMYLNGYPNQINPNMEYGTHYNKDIKIYNIPVFLLLPSIWDAIETFDRPNPAEMAKIATKNTEEIWLWMPLHAIQIEEVEIPGPQGSSNPQTQRNLSACFHMFLFSIKDHSIATHKAAKTMHKLPAAGNRFHQDIVYNMFTSLRNVEQELTRMGYTVSKDAMNDFVQQYSLYSELCRAAERWCTQADYYMADVMVKNLNNHTGGKLNSIWTDSTYSATDVLGRLEKYGVPLDQYHTMYYKMAAIVKPDILTAICRANLNLKLSNTLHHMNQNRAQMKFCPCNNHVQTRIPYSIEQRAALESTSPLTLVQSGAGTGKSTVILGRINHMVANGIKPEDIMVLSFTNAAANHIKDLNPQVHSMTIAAMLHTIYNHNHPTHQLSTIQTLVNSLDIFFAKNMGQSPAWESFIYNFKHRLERLDEKMEFTKCLNFVEDHLDDVITALDTVEQTTLELENIICYLCMDTMVEPPEVQTEHLIIDEVQDNAVSEFVYTIKYADKHKCSLYYVGDCSQTLYEFRASNPKALNVLENSGVFDTYKLQTNYRSNQEILDFANVLLGTIEANQYANIRLKANSLKPVTLQSFQDAVTIHYERLANKNPQTKENMLAHSIAIDARKYMDDKLAKGEQVAILAPTRAELRTIETNLKAIYPGKSIISLVPGRSYESDILSKFIAKYWNTIQYTPPTNILATVRREIMSKILYITKAYKSQKALTMMQDQARYILDGFEKEYTNHVQNWQKQVAMSVMPSAVMLTELKKLLISYEIRKNAIAQAIQSSRNAEKRLADDVDNANFILSTIHSAKGLEFDNVVVYYENKSNMDEPDKRKYYVAFTRAKKTEFIFAYDTMARPSIVGDYDRIIKDLEAKQSGQPVPAASGTTSGSNEPDEGNNTDDDEQDENA